MTADTAAPSLREALELKPCPFCGAAGETLIRGFRYPGGSSQKEGAVWCPTCDCKGPEKAWNTRATPPAPTPSAARERIARLWQDLLDKDDRTSPEEYPDMALITFDEFEQSILALLPDAAAITEKDAEIRTLRMALEDATTGITAATVEAEIRAAAFEEAAGIAMRYEANPWPNAGRTSREIAAAIRAAGEK